MKEKFPEISLIVAMTESGLIGKDGGLPWKSSLDMKWFREHTVGWPVIVGRRTAEGMGKKFPLQNRPCVVVSSKVDSTFGAILPGIRELAFNSLYTACSYFSNFDKVFIAGGAKVYRSAFEAVWVSGEPMVDSVIKTVFPNECILDYERLENDTVPVMGDKYLDKDTLSRIKEPQFSLAESQYYEYLPKKNLYYDHKKDEVIALKDGDTLFPWVRFEIWKRQKSK